MNVVKVLGLFFSTSLESSLLFHSDVADKLKSLVNKETDNINFLTYDIINSYTSSRL